ncbi:cytidine deaminase [Arthrobacter livingstonensis]|uniref:Cytidine deaminase n=1 Tax=Arthrobacter livingstonensis TaxID=670078 RepID=A0A2V5LA01_9MICC|nr:cytidine deaminase [Arthrobacter livingstonensis]PYI68541.1 cytidine deaminase [Arthrobacter livingstonensis]
MDNTTSDAGSPGSASDAGSPLGALGGGIAQADWDVLHAAATAAMGRAYAPYSKFPVGAAALLEDGRVVSGCNVENASYGLTLCAECTMVGALQMGGGGRIRAFYCVDAAGTVLMPCGRCRQLLYEFRAPGMVLMTSSGIRTMDQVLPDAFGPDNLEKETPA